MWRDILFSAGKRGVHAMRGFVSSRGGKTLVLALAVVCLAGGAFSTEFYAWNYLLPKGLPIHGAQDSTVDWSTVTLTLATPDVASRERLATALHETAPICAKSLVTEASREGVFLLYLAAEQPDLEHEVNIPPEQRAEGYMLAVAGSDVIVYANSERGLFNGVMSLEQVVQLSKLGDATVPGCIVADFPRIPMRGPHEDFGRDQLPTMEDLKRSIRMAAQYKMNTYFWFIEPDHFVYEFDPEISTDYDRFTFDEIRELVAYAKSLYVEVIPVVELLAHMEMTLRHDRYKHLSETGDGGGTLCPTSDESFALVKRMIDEIAPAFGARYFHCGLDESEVAGTGRSADAVAEKGIAQVYADYYTRVNQAVRAHGQTMIMYADIVLNHPEILELLPKDIVLMFWDYMPRERYEGLDKLKEMGFQTMSLSGMWDWANLYPVYPPGFENMCVLAKQTAEIGGLGHFVSSWGDGYRGAAGINLSELNAFGFIYCGAVSWYPGSFDRMEDYARAFAASYYGVLEDAFSDALVRLARCQGDGLGHTTRARRLLHDNAREHVLAFMGQGDGATAFWRNLRSEAEAAHQVFRNTEATRNADYLRSVDLAAQLLAFTGEMALTYYDTAQALMAPGTDRAPLVERLKALEKRHRGFWEAYRAVYAATNRPINLNHLGGSWLRASDELAALANDIQSGAFPPAKE
jgi:hypothetical protein